MMWRVVLMIVVAALLMVWAQTQPSGQPFHEPGQSDRSVIWQG